MVKIPRRNPLQGSELSTQAPAVRTQPGANSRTAEASQAFLQKTEEVAQRFENIQILNEKTEAKTISAKRLAELEERALTQPDVYDKKTLTDEIAKIKSETAKGISLPYARNAYEYEYEGLALMANTRIDATLRKRQMADSQVKMYENFDAMEGAYTKADSQPARKMILDGMGLLIDEHVSTGLLTPAQGEAEKAKQRTRFIDADVYDEFENNLDFTIDQLALGEEGIYADVDAKKRQTLLTAGLIKQKAITTELKRQDTIKKNDVLMDFTLRSIDPSGKDNPTYSEIIALKDMKDYNGDLLFKESQIKMLFNLAVNTNSKKRVILHRPTYDKIALQYSKILDNEGDEELLFKDMAMFNKEMVVAVNEGRLGKQNGDMWAKQTQKIYQSKLDGVDLVGLKGLSAVKGFFAFNLDAVKKSKLTETQQDKVFMNVNEELMKRIDLDKDYTNKEITELATSIWNVEAVNMYPSLVGVKDVPTHIATKDGGISQVTTAQSDLKGTVKPKPQKEKNEGFVVMMTPDGKQRNIPKDKVDEAIKNGASKVGQ